MHKSLSLVFCLNPKKMLHLQHTLFFFLMYLNLGIKIQKKSVLPDWPGMDSGLRPRWTLSVVLCPHPSYVGTIILLCHAAELTCTLLRQSDFSRWQLIAQNTYINKDGCSVSGPTVQRSIHNVGADRLLSAVAQMITLFDLTTQGQHLIYIPTSREQGDRNNFLHVL